MFQKFHVKKKESRTFSLSSKKTKALEDVSSRKRKEGNLLRNLLTIALHDIAFLLFNFTLTQDVIETLTPHKKTRLFTKNIRQLQKCLHIQYRWYPLVQPFPRWTRTTKYYKTINSFVPDGASASF